MLEAILQTLQIMGWLGVVFFILVIVNTMCGVLYNINNGEKFSWKKLFKGLLKALVFYISSVATAIAFTLLPFINNLITNAFEVELLSPELLNTLSSVAVLTIVITATITQGKKALEGIKSLSNISIATEDIDINDEEEINLINNEEEEELENGID